LRPILNTNNKKKIINDPIYGFISLPNTLIFDLVEHPFFQRLRRIKQLGMTHLVYPGALHTRFHHSIGATHLMGKAIQVLRKKGIHISDEEETAVQVAILLHDIGHGPFSHTLEHDIVKGVSHEELSVLFMRRLSEEFDGQLDMALLIFQDKYHKKFLHQLVSSQLDMDRMDYLNRDSFYTGVSEGVIGSDRIIEMLNVHNDRLVVEQKGIYSIEKFLVARRIMYWQVYMHKTVVSSEVLLTFILKRAKELIKTKTTLFASPSFLLFLENDFGLADFKKDPDLLNHFANLDDYDILGAIKVWQNHEDNVLSELCRRLINRRLFKIEIAKTPFSLERLTFEREMLLTKNKWSELELNYFVFTEKLTNNAYNEHKEVIKLLMKNGSTLDVSKASDNLNISALSKPVEKYYLCYAV
jgi:HD superfamily phosphohydrolase